MLAVAPAALSLGSVAGPRLARTVTTPRPTVVQRVVVAVPGLQGTTPGPRAISVRFPRPTRPGDLLVAGVDDGVETSGMVHAHYVFTGWRQAVTTIGGETAGNGEGSSATGGLQASIFFYPQNPGGISLVKVATVPRHSLAWVSVVLVELAGVRGQLSVDTTGTSTSGPSSRDYSQVSTVTTSSSTTHHDDLVFALFNNGGNTPHGERFVNSPGWTVLGRVRDPNNNEQPILFDDRIEPQLSVVSETDRYEGGYPIDNVAVIAALT